MSARLQLRLERDRYQPGDAVRGTIVVLEGGRSRSLEALLEYWEKTADYRAVAIRISSGPLHEGDLTTGTSFDFEVALPEDARPNYASAHGDLFWQVDARSDEFGRDTHERARIEVGAPAAAGVADGSEAGEPPQTGQPSTTGFARSAGPAPGRASSAWSWLWLVFFAGGVVALVVGVVMLVLTLQFVARAQDATGTVIDFDVTTDADGSESFFPVVRFTTAEGREIVFVSSSGANPPSASLGDQVDVLYDPDDPDDARLSGFFDLWLFPGVSLVLGVAFIAGAWYVRRQMRTSKQADANH